MKSPEQLKNEEKAFLEIYREPVPTFRYGLFIAAFHVVPSLILATFALVKKSYFCAFGAYGILLFYIVCRLYWTKKGLEVTERLVKQRD